MCVFRCMGCMAYDGLCVCAWVCVHVCVHVCMCVFQIVPKANWTLDEFLIWHVTHLLHVHTHVCVHMFLSFAAFYSASDKAGLISLRAATILKMRNQLLPILRTKPGIWLQDSSLVLLFIPAQLIRLGIGRNIFAQWVTLHNIQTNVFLTEWCGSSIVCVFLCFSRCGWLIAHPYNNTLLFPSLLPHFLLFTRREQPKMGKA